MCYRIFSIRKQNQSAGEWQGGTGGRLCKAAGGDFRGWLHGLWGGLEGDRRKHSQETCRGSDWASSKSSLAPSLLSSRLYVPLLAKFRIIHLKMEKQERYMAFQELFTFNECLSVGDRAWNMTSGLGSSGIEMVGNWGKHCLLQEALLATPALVGWGGASHLWFLQHLEPDLCVQGQTMLCPGSPLWQLPCAFLFWPDGWLQAFLSLGLRVWVDLIEWHSLGID